MKKFLFGITLSFVCVILLCVSPVSAQSQWERKPEWQKHFQQAKANGSFLLFDLKNNRYSAFNVKRAETRFLPASTFKIFNSLVALETGVVGDENEVFAWDGVDRGLAAWNKDQDMKTAIQNSTVWFYQRLARRIGPERMQKYLREARYGNGQINGGIEHFWLNGGLRISSPEQIELLVRLHQNKLPFSERATDIVKRILIQESNDEYVFRAKTGWVGFDAKNANPFPALALRPQIGWLVGYVERKENVYFFAANIDISKKSDPAARLAVTKNVLRELKIVN